MSVSGFRQIAFLLVLGAAAMPVVADTKDETATAPASEKKVCRSIESTGSMLTRRICHTKAEWQAIDGQNRVNANQFGTATQGNFGGERPR